MRLFDTHIHSLFSRDSKTPVESAIQAAISTGLEGLAFTDHCDFSVHEDHPDDFFDIEQHQAEIIELGRKYASQIQCCCGIEIGLQIEMAEHINAITTAHHFDIIIASLHWVYRQDPYRGAYYEGKSLKESYGGYLECLYQAAQFFQDYDVLGHYDYISRYSPYPKKSLRYKDFPDHLDSLLRLLITRGKCLELNTGSFRSRNGQQAPQFDPDLYKRYRELGGELVNLGSDAHEAARVGADFSYYAAQLKQIGFDYLCHYKNREPIFTLIS
jgi:histidinol phosphate phosphatase HisJ family